MQDLHPTPGGSPLPAISDYSFVSDCERFEGEEGTFTICSFWLVSALTDIGEVARARALCEKLLSLASPLLLFAEEIDRHTGRHLGNFPQAFSHLALSNAVMHVIHHDGQIAASAVLASGLDPVGAENPAAEREV